MQLVHGVGEGSDEEVETGCVGHADRVVEVGHVVLDEAAARPRHRIGRRHGVRDGVVFLLGHHSEFRI